jgi:hypothetical protein
MISCQQGGSVMCAPSHSLSSQRKRGRSCGAWAAAAAPLPLVGLLMSESPCSSCGSGSSGGGGAAHGAASRAAQVRPIAFAVALRGSASGQWPGSVAVPSSSLLLPLPFAGAGGSSLRRFLASASSALSGVRAPSTPRKSAVQATRCAGGSARSPRDSGGAGAGGRRAQAAQAHSSKNVRRRPHAAKGSERSRARSTSSCACGEPAPRWRLPLAMGAVVVRDESGKSGCGTSTAPPPLLLLGLVRRWRERCGFCQAHSNCRARHVSAEQRLVRGATRAPTTRTAEPKAQAARS